MIYKGEREMSDCRFELSGLEFCADKGERRVGRAMDVLGEKVVLRLLAFAVFLLGAERKATASVLGIPLGTLLSLLTRVGKVGLPAFEDRRRSHTQFRPAVPVGAPPLTVAVEDGQIVIHSGDTAQLRMPVRGGFQSRVILLSLVNGGALSPREAAEMLGCTAAHVRTLCTKLQVEGAESLLDRRRGQKQDYRITAEVKSELVVQAAAHAMTDESVSSAAVTTSVNERMGWQLSERTVRVHMRKLGLAGIVMNLPALVERIKGGSRA